MQLYWTPYLYPLLLALVIVSALSIYSLFHRKEQAALIFFLTMFTMFVWIGAYLLEIACVSKEWKLIWANIQFAAIGAAPVLWVITTLRLIGRPVPKPHSIVLLLLIPVITNILAWTHETHHLFRGDPIVVMYPGIILLQADYAWWHNAVFVPFVYLLFLFSFIILVHESMHAKKVFRRHYLFLIFGIVLPLLGSVLYVFSVPPFENFNPTSILFSFTGIFFGPAIFKFNMFDILPLAWDTIIGEIKDGIIVIDNRERILDYNDSAKLIFPALKQSSVGKPIAVTLKVFGPYMDRMRTVGQIDEELKISLAGSTVFFNIRIFPVTNNREKVVGKTILVTDVTEKTKLLQKLHSLASIDDLTRVYNRRYFFELFEIEIDRAQRKKQPLSLILIDLDKFKRVNDNYGHAVGDTVLKEVAAFCKNSLRRFDILGRYGGEEFIVFLPETKLSEAHMVAERIRTTIERTPITIGEKSLSITSSFGIASRESEAGITSDMLFALADKALYEAKEKGRNTVIASPPL